VKLNKTPRKPVDAETDLWYRQVAQQVNGLSEGLIAASYTAIGAAPTTGTWTQGDFVRNIAPSVMGTSPNQYIVFGWTCVVGGVPGTWVESRYLTGT
jgi:hypothetical protein